MCFGRRGGRGTSRSRNGRFIGGVRGKSRTLGVVSPSLVRLGVSVLQQLLGRVKTTYLEQDESGEHECRHNVAGSKVAHGRGQGRV